MKRDRHECESYENMFAVEEALKISRGNKLMIKKHVEMQKHKDQFG
jgi:hypothetical protein